MRVARLELNGVGPFEAAVFEIPEPTSGAGELVLFEGPNGAGKTTVVQALAVLIGEGREDLSPPSAQFRERFREGGKVLLRAEHGSDWDSSEWEPAHGLLRNGSQGTHLLPLARRQWAAFAYRGHQPTPVVATKGPSEIETTPLRSALAFGTDPASAHFGQLLVNLDQEVAKAFREAHRADISPERKQEMEQLASSRQKMLDEIARALSEALDRRVTFEVPVGQHAPSVSLDGENIPLDLLGEGMRSTFAWLADLLVRLHRIPWEDAQRSPLEQDFWLILDEIDESLHPTMQARIYPALRKLFPRARIYATTHSPFVVASVGEGVIFPIRPDRDHKVRGAVNARALHPGESLELVTEEIFQARYGFVDQPTRDALAAHDRDVQALERKKEIDWSAFLARRAQLMGLNDEVQTVVAMQEVRVQKDVQAKLRERAAGEERATVRSIQRYRSAG
jgi:energy-coupling factor transporter ATP-binding protein EcfA2